MAASDDVIMALDSLKINKNKFQRRAGLLAVKRKLESENQSPNLKIVMDLLEIATSDQAESCREIACQCLQTAPLLQYFLGEEKQQVLPKLLTCISHRLNGIEDSEVVMEQMITLVDRILCQYENSTESVKSILFTSMKEVLLVICSALEQKSPDLKLLGCSITERFCKILSEKVNIQNEPLLKALVANVDHNQGKVRRMCMKTIGSLVSLDHVLLPNLEETFLHLVDDQNFQVRMELVGNLAKWFQSWDDRHEHIATLLTLLLISSVDEYREISECATTVLNSSPDVVTDSRNVTLVLDKVDILFNDWKPQIRTLGARCLLGLAKTRQTFNEEVMSRIVCLFNHVVCNSELSAWGKQISSELGSTPNNIMTVLETIEKDEDVRWDHLFLLSTVLECCQVDENREDLKKVVMNFVTKRLDGIKANKRCHSFALNIAQSLVVKFHWTSEEKLKLIYLLLEFGSLFLNLGLFTEFLYCLKQIVDAEPNAKNLYTSYISDLQSREADLRKIFTHVQLLALLKDPVLAKVLPALASDLKVFLKSSKLEDQEIGLKAINDILSVANHETLLDENVLSSLTLDGLLPILQFQHETLAQKVRALAARCLNKSVVFGHIDTTVLYHRLVDSLEDDSQDVRIEMLRLAESLAGKLDEDRRLIVLKNVVGRLDDKSSEVRILASKVAAQLVTHLEMSSQLELEVKKMALFLKDEDSRTRKAVFDSLCEIGKKHEKFGATVESSESLSEDMKGKLTFA